MKISKLIFLPLAVLALTGCSLGDFGISEEASKTYDEFHYKVENVEVIGTSNHKSGGTTLYTTNLKCTATNDSKVDSAAYWELVYARKNSSNITIEFGPYILKAGASKDFSYSYGDQPYELGDLIKIKRYEYFLGNDAFEVGNYQLVKEESLDVNDNHYSYEFTLDFKNKLSTTESFSGTLVFVSSIYENHWYEQISVADIGSQQTVTKTFAYRTDEWQSFYGKISEISVEINPVKRTIND